MQQYRVCLAPLRFGAGLKGKIVDSWAHGTPVCTTPIGAEGMLPTISEGCPDLEVQILCSKLLIRLLCPMHYMHHSSLVSIMLPHPYLGKPNQLVLWQIKQAGRFLQCWTSVPS